MSILFPGAMGADQVHSSVSQEPSTPLPPTPETTHTLNGNGPVTPIPISEELITGVTRAILHSNKMAAASTQFDTSTYPGWTPWINGGVADNYVNPIPSYNSNHFYSFTIHLQQAGYLTFAIGDTYTKDNTGYLSLTVTQEN